MVPTNSPTRWEIEFRHADGRVLPLGLTARHTKKAMLAMMVTKNKKILAEIGPGEFNAKWNAKNSRWEFDGVAAGWTVQFGRTEREIKNKEEPK